jgi:hypothetical protein
MQALVSEGRIDEAPGYAEASRGLNQPDAAIDAACEEILLDLGRADEAYERYALTANGSSDRHCYVPIDRQEISQPRPEEDPLGFGHIEP